MRFSVWPAEVPYKLPRLANWVLSRAVVNRRGDFPNGFLFDRPVNNARGEKRNVFFGTLNNYRGVLDRIFQDFFAVLGLNKLNE